MSSVQRHDGSILVGQITVMRPGGRARGYGDRDADSLAWRYGPCRCDRILSLAIANVRRPERTSGCMSSSWWFMHPAIARVVLTLFAHRVRKDRRRCSLRYHPA